MFRYGNYDYGAKGEEACWTRVRDITSYFEPRAKAHDFPRVWVKISGAVSFESPARAHQVGVSYVVGVAGVT